LYAHKTNVPVWIPLPKVVVEALDACDKGGEFYFYTGNGKVKTWTTEWEERLKKVFVIAGIPEGHSHHSAIRSPSHSCKPAFRWNGRDSLGNTLRVAERHYSHG